MPRSLILALVVSFCAACGGSPPPPPQKPAAPPAPKVSAPPPPDTSAVPRPDGLVVFARLSKPEATLKVVGGWTGIPMPGSEVVSELLTGATVGKVIDLGQPIDVAVGMAGDTMAPRPLIAVSAAGRSLEGAEGAVSASHQGTPGANRPPPNQGTRGGKGRLRIEGPGGEDGERPCALVPAATGTRIVCGDGPAALEALEPWLARSAPRDSFSQDLHVDVRLAPVRPTVQSLRSMLP